MVGGSGGGEDENARVKEANLVANEQMTLGCSERGSHLVHVGPDRHPHLISVVRVGWLLH